KRNYGSPGKFLVKLYVKNVQGCTYSIDKEIMISVLVEFMALCDTELCLSVSVYLFPSCGLAYVLSQRALLSCADCTNPFAFPTEKTTYNVISTDINGCHDTANVVVDIKTHVESIAGDGGEICDGESITLSVSGARSYLWSPS